MKQQEEEQENLGMQVEKQERKPNLIFKMVIVGLITLLLMIPTFMIDSLINDRLHLKNQVEKEMMQSWGENQVIGGMIISVPYTLGKSTSTIFITPDSMKVNAHLLTESKHRSIYDIMIYTANTKLECLFGDIKNKIPKEVNPASIQWENAKLLIGISDLKGLAKESGVKINGKSYTLSSNMPSNSYFREGLSSYINLSGDLATLPIQVSIYFDIRGCKEFEIRPTGKITTTTLTGNTDNASFFGDFLTVKNTVEKNKFSANWSILEHNRPFVTSWLGENDNLYNGVYGVKILDGIDSYDKTKRSLRYAILVIGLTMFFFFFIELIYKKMMHPFQYILIGFALCLFYALLLSISEYIAFGISYLIASIATIGLISWFSASILKDKNLAIAITTILTAIYITIYILISMEAYALLCGTIGLFIILALIMHFSKKIDWK